MVKQVIVGVLQGLAVIEFSIYYYKERLGLNKEICVKCLRRRKFVSNAL